MQRKRPGGRQARDPEPGRVPISFRVTPAFKAELDYAAKRSGRSLAQEIELRLERSIDAQHWLRETLELAFDRQTAALMLAIGCAVQGAAGTVMMLESPRRASWLSNAFAFRQVTDAINKLLQLIKPVGDSSELPPRFAQLLGAETKEKAMLEGLAVNSAKLVAEEIAGLSPEFDVGSPDAVKVDVVLSSWGPVIRDWFGDAIVAHLRDRVRSSSPSPNMSSISVLEGGSVGVVNTENPGRVRRKRLKHELPK